MPESSLNVYVKVSMQDLKKSGVIVRLLGFLNIYFFKVIFFKYHFLGCFNPAVLSHSVGNINAFVTFWKP